MAPLKLDNKNPRIAAHGLRLNTETGKYITQRRYTWPEWESVKKYPSLKKNSKVLKMETQEETQETVAEGQ